MKHPLLFAVLCAWPSIASPEKATFDLVRYTPPAPWKNTAWKMDDTNRDRVSYTNTDLEKRTYCQIFIVRSTISKGDVSSDFASEWKEIVVNSYKVTEPAQVTDTAEENGWKAKAGVALATSGARSRSRSRRRRGSSPSCSRGTRRKWTRRGSGCRSHLGGQPKTTITAAQIHHRPTTLSNCFCA